MPSGKTHDRITLWGLPWVVLLALFCTRNATLALIISGMYLFGGLMFGPDLDIYSIQYKRWGWLRWLWLPYQKSLRHRSKLSHGFVVGTLLRLIYLLAILLIVGMISIAIAQLIWGFDWNWQAVSHATWRWLAEHRGRCFAVFVGLELGAMSHSIADAIGSRRKQWQKQNAQKQTAQHSAKQKSQTRKRKFKP